MSPDNRGSFGGAPRGGGDVRPPGASGEPAFQFKDRRRIDPDSGAVRSGSGLPDPGSVTADPANPANAAQPVTGRVTADSEELAAAKLEAAERTADLQRITAEYANYRKRTDRDRAMATVAGKAAVIGELLSVLDDLDRAEQHGDLAGPFKAVGDRLTEALTRQGLGAFGTAGDAFDPTVHEAVQFDTSAEVDRPTVTAVFRRGYLLSDRVLRPAVVVVTGPDQGKASAAPSAPAGDPGSGVPGGSGAGDSGSGTTAGFGSGGSGAEGSNSNSGSGDVPSGAPTDGSDAGSAAGDDTAL